MMMLIDIYQFVTKFKNNNFLDENVKVLSVKVSFCSFSNPQLEHNEGARDDDEFD